jgi:hypothetical protein
MPFPLIVFLVAFVYFLGKGSINSLLMNFAVRTPAFKKLYLESGKEKSLFMASKMSIMAMLIEDKLRSRRITEIEEKNKYYKEMIYDYVNNVINDESKPSPAPRGYSPEFWLKLATLDGGLEPWIHSDWSDEDLENYIKSDYNKAKILAKKVGVFGKHAEFYCSSAAQIVKDFKLEIKRIQHSNFETQRKYKNT